MQVSSKTTNREHTLTHFNKSNQMLKSASIQYVSEKRSYPYFVAVGITAMAVQILEGLQLFLQSVYKIVKNIVVEFNKDNIRNSADDALTSLLLTFFKICNVATRLLFSFVAPSIAIGCCELSDSQIQTEKELDDLLQKKECALSTLQSWIQPLHKSIINLKRTAPVGSSSDRLADDYAKFCGKLEIIKWNFTFIELASQELATDLPEKFVNADNDNFAENTIPHRKKDILKLKNHAIYHLPLLRKALALLSGKEFVLACFTAASNAVLNIALYTSEMERNASEMERTKRRIEFLQVRLDEISRQRGTAPPATEAPTSIDDCIAMPPTES